MDNKSVLRRAISLVICDLDNTLYDWVTFFARSFYAMVDTAVPLLRVDREQLLDELQAIHRKYHNSEHPFALLETPSVKRRFSKCTPAEIHEHLADAFHAFNSTRAHTLCLYPGVRETLDAITKAGAILVAHTEATVINANYRLSKLQVSQFFRKLYAVQDADTPHPRPSAITPVQHVASTRTLLLHEKKPDTRVLFEICGDAGVHPQNTIYIGDSKSRDIGMANAAGAHSAWAAYGTKYDPADWARLVRITHWTKEDVARAQQAAETYRAAIPDVTLHESMLELLDHVAFEEPTAQLRLK